MKLLYDVAERQGLPPLPDDWHYELSDYDANVVHIVWPDHGAVSVNFKCRTTSAGWGDPGRAKYGVEPKRGNGWRFALVSEAVEILKAAWKSEYQS